MATRKRNPVPEWLHRYATPFTTGLFIVSAVSGAFLFVHTGQGLFHEMHEWLSMLLLVPFGLHLWRNWSSLLAYAHRGRLVWPLLVCLLIAAPFAIGGLRNGNAGGGRPPFAAIAKMENASIATVAPVFGTTPNALIEMFRAHGLHVDSPRESIAAVAQASGRSPGEILSLAAGEP